MSDTCFLGLGLRLGLEFCVVHNVWSTWQEIDNLIFLGNKYTFYTYYCGLKVHVGRKLGWYTIVYLWLKIKVAFKLLK